MTTRLENWSVGPRYSDPYLPPELHQACLRGEVYGHPVERHYDGKSIVTSIIEKAEGRTVTTHTGTVYELGEIDPDYLDYIKENNISYDPDNPITIHEEI